MGKPRMSLAEYVAANPPSQLGAWLPSIPEFDAIKEAWLAGTVTQTQIRRWLLDECGYDENVATVARIAWLSKYQSRRARGRS